MRSSTATLTNSAPETRHAHIPPESAALGDYPIAIAHTTVARSEVDCEHRICVQQIILKFACFGPGGYLANLELLFNIWRATC